MSKPWYGFFYWFYPFLLEIIIHGIALVLYNTGQPLLYSLHYAILDSLLLGLLFLLFSQNQYDLYKEKFQYYRSFSLFLAPFLVLIPLLFLFLLFDPASLGLFGGSSSMITNEQSGQG